jgi:hydrogenase maturation protease
MWLVIGYGNSLRSDDRFGLEVCNELQSYAAVEQLVEIIITQQLTPDLIEAVSKASGVIFVDASTDLAPAQMQFISLEQSVDRENLSSAKPNSPFSHHCTPQVIFQAAQSLYGRVPQGWLCTVGGAYFELGEELSPLVKATIPEAVHFVLEKVGVSRTNTVQSISGAM